MRRVSGALTLLAPMLAGGAASAGQPLAGKRLDRIAFGSCAKQVNTRHTSLPFGLLPQPIWQGLSPFCPVPAPTSDLRPPTSDLRPDSPRGGPCSCSQPGVVRPSSAPSLPATGHTCTSLASAGIGDTNPDLWLWLGDAVYTKADRANHSSLASMQEMYALQRANPAYTAFRSRPGMAVDGVWDDHDYGVNDAGILSSVAGLGLSRTHSRRYVTLRTHRVMMCTQVPAHSTMLVCVG